MKVDGEKMEIEILTKKENILFERTELDFKATHAKEPTPSREKIREKLSAMLDVKKELVVVDHMDSKYGAGETIGRAKAYKNLDKLKVVERDYVLIRNKLKEKPAPGTKKKKGAAPAKK